MPNNWKEQLDARQAGEVPGFIGSNETIEDFAAREAEHRQAELDAAAQPANVDAAQGSAVATAVAEATSTRTPAKAPAKKSRARARK